MFEYIRGTLVNKTPGFIVIEVGGIGFGIKVPDSAATQLPAVGQEGLVYTYLHVREDALALFGFTTPLERTVFLSFLGVEGIGPRIAMAALSAFSAQELVQIVRSGDVNSLLRVNGIGKKTAQRIILELKEKLALTLSPESPSTAVPQEDLAAAALAQLGYSPDEIGQALAKVDGSADVGTRVRAALEVLRKG